MNRKTELSIEEGGYLARAAIYVRDARKAWDPKTVLEHIREAKLCLDRAETRVIERLELKDDDTEIPF